MSETNETIASLAKTMYTVTQNERVRFMCERRLESEKTCIAYEEDVLKAEQRADIAEQKLAYLLSTDPSLQAKLDALQIE